MSKRKITCTDITCKNNDRANKSCVLSSITIESQTCQSYEKGFQYYLNLVWNELLNTTTIISGINDDLKIGLYYVMKIYGLHFGSFCRGSWEWISLVDENNKALDYYGIIARDFNFEEFSKLLEDFNNGILPNSDQKQNDKPIKSFQPLGWLSPTGEFVESDWGHHEESAFDIVEKNGWEDDWDDWKRKNTSEYDILARDYIVKVKNYVLIDNPSGDGSYNVTHDSLNSLTKKQKDFLYNYFMDMGTTLRAELYLEE